MKTPTNETLLKIFIGKTDSYEKKPLYEWIVLKARELHIAGATVTRGIMGYGATTRIHSTQILRLSEDMPVIIEIVDTREKIDTILPYLDDAVQEGLITLNKIDVIQYRYNKRNNK